MLLVHYSGRTVDLCRTVDVCTLISVDLLLCRTVDPLDRCTLNAPSLDVRSVFLLVDVL